MNQNKKILNKQQRHDLIKKIMRDETISKEEALKKIEYIVEHKQKPPTKIIN